MPGENQLKGQAFKGLASAVVSLHGEAVLKELVQALPEELRATWQHGGLVSGGWYPIGWYREFHVAAHKVLPAERQLARKLSHEATRLDLQGIYRFVLQFLSPRTLMGQAPRIFGLYNRGGRVEVAENQDSHVALAYHDCHGNDRNIWEDIIGGSIATLEVTRVKITSITVLEGGGDSPHMQARFRWEQPAPSVSP